jgi:hypothetical protein
MWLRCTVLIGFLVLSAGSWAEEPEGTRPLLSVRSDHVNRALPSDTVLMQRSTTIEAFLDQVDREPPDWTALWGHGEHGHDERLFALNRERDARRERPEARRALSQRLTFFWSGELSEYDPRSAGFRVAVGPRFLPTRWGLVRFKAEGLPSDLMAVPKPSMREALRSRVARGEKIEVEVAITGRLVPEESLIYDFAHDEPGLGLIMPVVRVERVDFLLAR